MIFSYLKPDSDCSGEDITGATSPALQKYVKERVRQERAKVVRAVHVGLLAFARTDDLQYHSLTHSFSLYLCL